jgi:cell division protein ZapA
MLRLAVQTVEDELTAIRDAGKIKTRERMAILAALNVAFRLAEQLVAPPPSPEELLEGQQTDRAMIDLMIQQIDAALPPANWPADLPPPLPPEPDVRSGPPADVPILTTPWMPPS